MLNDELLFFHRASLGDIPTNLAFKRIVSYENDPVKLRAVIQLLHTLIEQTRPTQEDFRKQIDSNRGFAQDEHERLFHQFPFAEAMQKAYSLPENEWANLAYLLLKFFAVFNKKQYKSVCRHGCTHEWHNLDKTIRTKDMPAAVAFYTSLGMQFIHHLHYKTESYEGKLGQSTLLIYRYTEPSRLYAGLKFHLRYRVPDFHQLVASMHERQIPVTVGAAENDMGLMATLADPDGRLVTLYEGI